MASLTQRMLGASKLDAATYEEIEADATATPQAMLVVVLGAVAGGVGAIRAMGVGGFVLAALASLLGWYVWAFITFVVGTRLLPGAKTEEQARENTAAADLAPLPPTTLDAVRRIYDEEVRAHVHAHW